MQSETTFESKQTEQRKKQEYELKVLNDANYLLRVKQDRENERRRATEEAKRSLALITQDIQTLEANMNKVFLSLPVSLSLCVCVCVSLIPFLTLLSYYFLTFSPRFSFLSCFPVVVVL